MTKRSTHIKALGALLDQKLHISMPDINNEEANKEQQVASIVHRLLKGMACPWKTAPKIGETTQAWI
jgi:hypothetical protein